MMIEVQLGEDANPAINLAGYSYVLNYNKDVVNESSLYVDFYNDGWFASSCNTLNMFKSLLMAGLKVDLLGQMVKSQWAWWDGSSCFYCGRQY